MNEQPPPQNLTQLLRDYIDRTGDSYSTIAKKTGLSKPTIGVIMTATEPRTYRPATLAALAEGLRVPLDVITRAANASAGIDTGPAPTLTRDDDRIIAEQVHLLTDAEAAIVRTMVQALTDRRAR